MIESGNEYCQGTAPGVLGPQMQRLTRLTYGFSKKYENLKAAYALDFAYYNFCRIHSPICCTPAMEEGITKGVGQFKTY